MSTNNTQSTPPTQTTAETPPGATHLDDASTLILDIRALGPRIPAFSFPADVNANRRLSSLATIPKAALDRITDLVQTRPLLTGNDIGPAELRDLVSMASAYSSVPDEAEAFAGAARHTLASALAKAGSAALVAYEVAKRLSKRPEGADLRPHVADIKRLLGPRFGRKKKAVQAPQPTPEAPTSPSTSSSSTPAPTSSQPKAQPAASAAGAADSGVSAPVTATKSQ
jgi:hypothetical protein